MLVNFAKAREGFIPYTPGLTTIPDDVGFEEFISQALNFEEIDILDFDGNTFELESDSDPTGSIFIFKNDNGSFLYKVTGASPYLHKSYFIWKCDCFCMETIENIDRMFNLNLPNTPFPGVIDALAIVHKNIFPSNYGQVQPADENEIGDISLSPQASLHTPKIEVKGNFTALNSFQKTLLKDDLLWLKIKCTVNPTTLELTSTSSDGSYNFLFPIRHIAFAISNTVELSSKLTMKNGYVPNDTGMVVKLSELISTYSPNIKSIEILPGIPLDTAAFGGAIISVPQDEQEGGVVIRYYNPAVATPCGIFIPQGYTDNYFPLLNSGNQFPSYYFPSQLVYGGGCRGFVQTPIGDIDIDFAKGKRDKIWKFFEDIPNNIASPAFLCQIREEGWLLDGAGRALISPTYLNFYTDNAGNVFIQNLTTNAQQLRVLNRQTAAQIEEQQQSYVLKHVQNAFSGTAGAIGSALTLNPLGVASALANTATTAINTEIENEFNKAKIMRDYSRAKLDYEDNIQTQSLLAKYTGKEIRGSSSIYDCIPYTNIGYFSIYIESNFTVIRGERPGPSGGWEYRTQPGYDYSCEVPPASFTLLDATSDPIEPHNYFGGALIQSNPLQIQEVTNQLGAFMKKLFGFYVNNSYPDSDHVFSYKNQVGYCCWHLTFQMVQTQIQRVPTSNQYINAFTKIIDIPLMAGYPLRKNWYELGK